MTFIDEPIVGCLTIPPLLDYPLYAQTSDLLGYSGLPTADQVAQ